MKKYIILLVLLSLVAYADNTCVERGHIFSNGCRTAVSCPPYLVDNDSMTLQIFPGCNSFWGICVRCKESVTVYGKNDTVIIWIKK